jgi:tetratricopeptide (TPR) repeat protein
VRTPGDDERKQAPISRRDLEHLRARCLIALDRPSEARSVLLGLTQGPEGAADGQAWIALGQVAHKLGDLQRMRIAANRAIAVSPDRPEGRMLLAAYRMETSDLPGALRAATEAMNAFPDDPGVRTLAALILREMGRHDDAAQALAGALQLDPENAQAASVLAAVETEN